MLEQRLGSALAKRSLFRMTVVLGLIASGVGAPAYAQTAGSATDAVTGWRCISPFCDVIIMPKTRCLCVKKNPGATTISSLRLSCEPPRGSQTTCPLPRGFGGN